jgi:hypothetical protein
MKRPSYSGIVLTESNSAKLLELVRRELGPELPAGWQGWEPIAHHVTLRMGGLDVDASLLSREWDIVMRDVAFDGRVVAARVDPVEGLPLSRENPHVTLLVNRAGGGRPFDSNGLDWSRAVPFGPLTLRGNVLDTIHVGEEKWWAEDLRADRPWWHRAAQSESQRLRIGESTLRRIVSKLLRETEGTEGIDRSGKGRELAARLRSINAEIERAGVLRWDERGFARVGLFLQAGSGGRTTIGFALDGGRGRPAELLAGDALEGAVRDLGIASDWGDLERRVPWGVIMVAPAPPSIGACLPERGGRRPWRVVFSRAERGWGPLLYDAAMEVATERGGGLMSDRHEVSAKALGVWTAYDRSRRDVEALQLDANDATVEDFGVERLTPDVDWDDCDQFAAANHMDLDWDESPLSRAYRKEPDLIDRLRADDLLWEE